MATQEKRPYEKPTLESSSIFGADTTTCCRSTTGSCSTTQRSNLGKTTRTTTTS